MSRRKNRGQRSRVDIARVIAEGKLAAVLQRPGEPARCPYRAAPVVTAWLQGFNQERDRMQTAALIEKENQR